MGGYGRKLAATSIIVLALPFNVMAQDAGPADGSTSAQLVAPPRRLISPRTQDSPLGIVSNRNQNTPGQESRSVETSISAAPVNTGLFPTFGTSLLNNGVDFHGFIVDHYLANPDVGNMPNYAASNLSIFRP